MSKVDIEELFDEYGIYYIDSGKNVKHGNINISCPFCGDDPSEHLGISLEPPYFYSCWRNNSHKGTLPYLLTKLLHISLNDAKELLGERSVVDLENFSSTLEGLFMDKKEAETEFEVTFPKEFQPLFNGKYSSKKFVKYLRDRGFTDNGFVEFYNLHYATKGDYADRVIIPVYWNTELVSWTSRSIYANVESKYKTARYCGEKREGYNIKDYVFEPLGITNQDRILVVTEGPLDALKMDWYGIISGYGIRSTCVFGVNYKEEQLYKLSNLAESFEKVIIMFDPDSAGKVASQKLYSDFITRKPIMLLREFSELDKDPGDLSLEEFKKIFSNV